MAIKSTDYTATKHRGLKIHKDGNLFLLIIIIDKKRYRKVWKADLAHNKSDKIKKAFLQLEEFRETKYKELMLQSDTNATVYEYWGKIKSIKDWSSNVTIDYQYYFDKHLQKIAPMKIKNLQPMHFTTLNHSLSYLGKRSRKKAYEILVPIITQAIEDEIIDKSPIKKSHIPVRNHREEKKMVLNAVEKYKAVYTAINELFKDNPHHKALFLFGFYGRRLGEVVSIKWEDLDLENNVFLADRANNKLSMDMMFSLPQDIKNALLLFADTQGDVFQVKNVSRYYKQIRELSGIEEFTFHWMRNLVTSALSTQGVEGIHLSAMLGHTSTTTLKQYLSLQRDKSTLRTNEIAHTLLGNQS